MLDRGLVLGSHVPRHRRRLPFGRNVPVPSWPGAIAYPTILRWHVVVGPDRSGRRFPRRAGSFGPSLPGLESARVRVGLGIGS